MDTTPKTQAVGYGVKYGNDSLYKDPVPANEYSKGVNPRDTLPAEWWNWLWGQVTEQELHTVADITALFTEVQNLLEEAGIEPSEGELTQITVAIRQLATEEIQGQVPTIISEHLALTKGHGEVHQDGSNKLYVPDVGDMDGLATTAKSTLTEAINELYSSVGQVAQSIPIGTIFPYAGESLPQQLSLFYVLCNGQNYTVAQGSNKDYYREIYNIIGHLYGYDEGNPEENFNVPDLRGGVIYGADANEQNFSTGKKIAPQDSKHTHQYSLITASYVYVGHSTSGTQSSNTRVVREIGGISADTTYPSTEDSDKGPLVKGVAINYIMKVR